MSRKLDMAIAEALGRKVEFKDLGEYGTDLFYADVESSFAVVPRYHKDCNAMLELDREMQERKYELALWHVDERYYAVYDLYGEGIEDVYDSIDREMPKTVTLAAYKALTGEEWTE